MSLDLKRKHSLLHGESGVQRPLLFSSAFFSTLLHVAFFAGFFLFPGQASPRRDYLPSVITVDMVTLPPRGDTLDPQAPVAEPSEPPPDVSSEPPPLLTADDLALAVPDAPPLPPMAEEPQPEPPMAEPPPETAPPEETVVIPESPAPAEEPVQKSDAQPPPESVKTLRKKADSRKPKDRETRVVTPETLRTDSIEKAIARVRKNIKQSRSRPIRQPLEQPDANRPPAAQENRYGVRDGSGTVKGGHGQISDVYKAQISYNIERNWAYAGNMAGGRHDLRSVVMIRILPSGQIDEVWFEERSGNRILDESAYKAVMKSDPLPPLPKGLDEYVIGLVFTPKGLN